ncbi:calcium-binding protein [Maritimibacter sp. DP1N21-5]|uniref:calcium-binding protein n=1 Tax=Maritimibacter sp. DP1N21-5 TaxID=2836867 RepID=UPI001C47E4D5|nr:calcium-binding protein [Maritimibacter sp. DP1N21-5]MBV7407995.1 hypothetical protein [Maritimibacter sp. DP1N21-5]
MKLTLNERPGTGLTVTSDLFGGNLLYTMNDLSGDSSYTRATQQVGQHGARWPGGTMTEVWGQAFYDDPNTLAAHVSGAGTFVGLDAFLDWSRANGQPATIVLPTRHMIVETETGARVVDAAAIAQAAEFVAQMIRQNPEVEIAAFELGNEYWNDAVGFTSAEYGAVANALSVAIQTALDGVLGVGARQPEILVQMGDQWGRDFRDGGAFHDAGLDWQGKIGAANDAILSQLTARAMSAIDGVTEHYYYNEPDNRLTLGDTPLWQADRYFKEINWDHQQWQAAFAAAGAAPLSLHITEWSPDQNFAHQWGLYGAGIVLEMFEGLLKMGADSAFYWPIEYTGRVDLAGNAGGDDGAFTDMLSSLGEVFRLMAKHTVGLELLNNGFSAADAAEDAVEVNAYGSDDRFVVFLSSRHTGAQSVQLDVSAYVDGFDLVQGERVTLAEDGAHWNEARRFGIAEDISTNIMGQGTLIDVELAPYEVVMVEFYLTATAPVADPDMDSDPGRYMRGWNRADRLTGGDRDDTIVGRGGNDRLVGGDGQDRLYGNTGRDALYGQDGNDRIWGHSGHDRITGGTGDDRIWGGLHNDRIWGQGGNDVLKGEHGHDHLDGGTGHDRIFGGSGNDRIWGGSGNDVLHGDSGHDRIWGGAGDDSIAGGSGNDRIAPGSGNDVIWGGWGRDTFSLRDGADEIVDFQNDHDRINLAGIGLSYDDLVVTKVVDMFTRGAPRDGVVVDYGEGVVFLTEAELWQIDERDFIF